MNLLSLTTNPTEDPLVFDTCWMTGLIQKGRVRVTVPRLDDGRAAAELAATQGIPAIHVERPEDLDTTLLRGATTVGLTAGASTPEAHILAMYHFLRSLP